MLNAKIQTFWHHICILNLCYLSFIPNMKKFNIGTDCINVIFSKVMFAILLSIDTLWFSLQSPGGLNSFGPIFTYWEQIFESILPLFFSSLNNFVSLFWKSRQGSQVIQEQKHFFLFLKTPIIYFQSSTSPCLVLVVCIWRWKTTKFPNSTVLENLVSINEYSSKWIQTSKGL